MTCRVLRAIAFVLGILLVTATADAGSPARVGFLCAMSGPSAHTREFQRGLRELGYVEGKNIVIEYRFADGDLARFRAFADEMVRLKVDVIVAASTAAIGPARDATREIPIVMAQSDDPVGAGFVASLARPGGNITGLSTLAAELSGKRLELLKQAVPGLSRVAVLWNTANAFGGALLRETEAAARVVGVRVRPVGVQHLSDLEGAFSAMIRDGTNGLIVQPDMMFFENRSQLLGLAARRRLPAVYEEREWAEAGGLIAYGPSYNDLFRRSASFVDKILKGAKPFGLPVEQPSRFDLFINLHTAKALGLTMPQSLLVRAEHVIMKAPVARAPAANPCAAKNPCAVRNPCGWK